MLSKRIITLFLLLIGVIPLAGELWAQTPAMYFGDTSRRGVPFSKDPHVIRFKEKYLIYYSIPETPQKGWGIGVAESQDLVNWKPIGEITPAAEYETKGLCAPAALVKDGKVHLFYQTYGNGPKDAICHAVSEDGISFIRNPTNPIFRPTGAWNNGRAIDAEVFQFKNQYLLYFATRDPAGKIQLQGVAKAPATTNFNREDWALATDNAILKPELDWEGDCVEGASIIRKGKFLYMFYAGNYNNKPQQIGVAKSLDGITWTRISEKPFLPHGQPGTWNSSESGHPHIFKNQQGKTYLFYQGNNNKGKTWLLSNVLVKWNRKGPYVDSTVSTVK